MRQVIVADDEPITRMDITAMLEELGFEVVGEAGDGFDAVELARAKHPDVALLDVKMPVFDGMAAARTILSENLAGCVVLLTAFCDSDLVRRAGQIGVTGYLVKPVEQRLLLPTLEVALAQSQRLEDSRRETEDARGQLRDSRVIAQAQGILSRQRELSPDQAYQLLRRMSMDKRTPLAALARAVVAQSDGRDALARAKERLMREDGLSESGAYRKLAERAKKEGCPVRELAERLCGQAEKPC